MPSNTVARRYASLKAAAIHYGISEKTLRRRISEGHLKGYRMGPRLIRVDLDEVEAMMMRPIPTAGPSAA
jgi:excisionase family DNA binding protein